MPKGNKGITIDNVQHPVSIFTTWTEAQRNAIGVYTVEIDNTNKKSEEYYVNTDITYSFGSGKVTGSYGTATAKDLADKTVDGVLIEGLKTIKKARLDQECASILAPSDWMVIKATETGTTMDSGWKTWRASVRTKCNSMQTQIDNAADVDALAALYTYTTTDGVTSRPLGEFPTKE
jgi:hypothetical protein